MTESEGRILRYDSPDPDPRKNLTINLIAPSSLTAQVTDTREIWRGRVWELAEKIKNDCQPEIDAGSITLNGAFKREASRYARPNGKGFTAESLRNSLNQQRNKQAGNP